MKNGFYILIVYLFVTIPLSSQDFNIPFSSNGFSNNYKVKMLRDSSFISLTLIQYLSKLSNEYDSIESQLVRYNKRGDILYYTKVILPSNEICTPTDIEISGREIFLSGYTFAKSTNKISGFLMRFNECLEAEAYTIYDSKEGNEPSFNKLFSLNDSTILATATNFIKSDTSFLTLFSLNHEFKINWHTSFMGYYSDILINNQNIHCWGNGYYPSSTSTQIFEIKLNYVIMDMNGNIKNQFVLDEHKDNASSFGRSIVKPFHGRFMIANIGLSSGKYVNQLVKIKSDGTFLKSVQLNDPKFEEGCNGICRINENRFIVIGGLGKDFFHSFCTAYLVDSNLNTIRSKKLLPNIKYVAIGVDNPIGFNNGALLYGEIYDSLPGSLYTGLIYKIDTFLNVVKKPQIIGFADTLCLSPKSGQICILPTPQTIWIDNLKIRSNIKLSLSRPIQNENNISIYPNPNNGNFKIHFNQLESGFVSIYNAIGELIISDKFTMQEALNFQFNSLTNAFYLVHIKTERYSVVKKLLVNY